MNITKENTGELTAVIKIQLEKSDYADQVKQVLNKYQKQAQMPGFRKGKVPFGVVKKMYGAGATVEEVNKIVSENLQKYIQENKIETLGQPIPNIEKTGQIDFDNGETFEFYFDLGLVPEFNLDGLNDLKVEYTKIVVDDETVTKFIEDAQSRLGETSHPEVIEEGDLIPCELIQLDEEGNEVEGGIRNETSLDLEQIQLKTIKKQIIGLKKDEETVFDLMRAVKKVSEITKLLNIDKDAAGKISGNYKLVVKDIVRVKRAELNDDFFKKVYPTAEIKTEDELREKVREDAQQAYSSESDRFFTISAMKAIDEKLNISLPDEFLKNWILSTNQENITPDQLENQYSNYADSFRKQLIEAKLMKEFDIQVTPDEVKAYIRDFFTKQFPVDEADEEANARMDTMVNSILQNQEESSKIFNQILEEKVSKVVKEKVQIEEKEVSYEEFIKLATNAN
ncbi:MAG: trigger factor [Bacteroidales bacterium]